MKLRSVRVENWRCYRAPFELRLDDFTAIIGRNDVGKSAILEALDAFFNEGRIDKTDVSIGSDPSSLSITCTFEELPAKLILDATNPSNLAQEYLLNNDGRLEVKKTFNGALAKPKVSSVDAIALHPTEEKYSDLLSLTLPQLRSRAAELGVSLDGVNSTKKADVRKAIWHHADELHSSLTSVSLLKETGKDVWQELQKFLPTFWLFKSDRPSTDQDSEAQDPLNLAIKQAISKVAPKLEEIASDVTREVEQVARLTLERIREMDDSLANSLNPIVTPKRWESMFNTSITGDDDIPINKRGSGVRRLVLLNFFRAKVELQGATNNEGAVIYAVEEPETSQHPNNQRLLLSTLEQLTADGNAQVIITTHTPMLARSIDDRSLRFVHDNGPNRALAYGGEEGINRDIANALGVLPDNGVKLFWGVEGPNDIEFLKAASKIYSRAGEAVLDIARLEREGVLIFIPMGGSTLALWSNRLAGLNKPEIYVCDRDESPPSVPPYQEFIDTVNERGGCRGFLTDRREMENYIHPDAIVRAYTENGNMITLPAQFQDFDDVPSIVAQALRANAGQRPWEEIDPQSQKKLCSKAKRQLNSRAMNMMTVEEFRAVDTNGEVLGWLSEATSMINE